MEPNAPSEKGVKIAQKRRVLDDLDAMSSQPTDRPAQSNGPGPIKVAGARAGLKRGSLSSFSDKRADLTSSMEIAAKAAQFQGFVAKVRGILAEMTSNMSDELDWRPEIDEDLLQALEFCRTQRQFCDCLHRANLNAQQKGLMFRLLTAIRDAKHLFDNNDDSELEAAVMKEVEKAKADVLALCTYDFIKGKRAVGDNALHVAFLFGLHEFGQEMISQAANVSDDPEEMRRKLIQRPYLNDLDPWFELALEAPDEEVINRPRSMSRRLSRQLSIWKVHPEHAASGEEAEEEDVEEYKNMVRRFRQLVLKNFPTADDQREARMPYNLLDDTNVAGRDGGLFTGETLLHLAIVQHLEETVEWLLEHGAALDARAAGIFFQPHQVETFGVKQQKLMAKYTWLSNISALIFDIGNQREKNSWGGTCYYGEFPLSFAASVGDVHICHILQHKAQALLLQGLQHVHDNVDATDDMSPTSGDRDAPYAARFLASMYMELGDQDNQDQSVSMGFDIQEEMKKLMSVFMNRSDARGNTALHMAVLHKKMAAITYLLSNGAQPSLRALNEHHFTPLTLAVRSGDSDIFQHITAQLEITAWQFGSARMVVQPLEQIDTFCISKEKPARSRKPGGYKKRSTGDTSMLSKIKHTASNAAHKTMHAASSAAHKSTELAATAIDKASSAAQGVGRFAKDAVYDVGKGLGIQSGNGGGGGLSALAKARSLDLKVHKEFFSKLVALVDQSAVTFATTIKDGVKMTTKSTNTARSSDLHSLHSNPNYRCALTVVVQHEINCFFDIPVFAQLVEDKWQKFGYRMHVRRVLIYAFFVIVTTFALDHRARSIRRKAFGKSDEEAAGTIICFMYTECASESEVSIQMVFDVCLYVLGIPYLLHQSWRNKRISIHDFDPNGDLDWSLNELFFFVYKNLNTVLSLATVCFLVGSLSDRTRNGVEAFWDSDALRGREQNSTPKFTELQCLALVTIFMYCNLLHMLLPFQSIGPVLITIWRMLMGDVVRWIIVYFFLLMAFSQAIIIAVQDTAMFNPILDEILEQGTNGMSISKTSLNTLDFVKYYVLVTLGDVSQPLVWQAGKTNSFIWMMHILFLVLSTLLLLNLIIAMMGETYAREKSNEGAAMWWMMKAWRVIDYETQLPRDKMIRWRSGVDPFTAGRDKGAVPFYHVEVSEADDGHDGGFKRDVRTLTELRKSVDRQFQRLEDRQKEIISESYSQFECSEEKAGMINDKLELLLQSVGVRSTLAARSPGPRTHHDPFHTHDSHPAHMVHGGVDMHRQDSPFHSPNHLRRLTPKVSTSSRSASLVPSMHEDAKTQLSLITGEESQSGIPVQGRPKYSSAVPRRQLRGLPPVKYLPEQLHVDGGGRGSLCTRQEGVQEVGLGDRELVSTQ